MTSLEKTVFRVACICSILLTRKCVKIGIICESSNTSSWQFLFRVGSAINIAQDKLISDGILQNETFSIVWKDTTLESDGAGHVADLVINDTVDVIFGSPSSRVTLAAAYLTSYWNFPHISWYASSFDLSNKKLFTTLIRTAGPLSEIGKSLVTLFQVFKWTRIGMLYIDYGLCSYCAQGVKNEFANNNLTIMQSIGYPQIAVISDTIIDDYLRLVKQTSRIIFLCVGELRRFMIRACLEGMCNGEHLFIYADSAHPLRYAWKAGDSNDLIAKLAYKYLLYVSISDYYGDDGKQRLDKFLVEVIERMTLPPWNSDFAMKNNITALGNAQNLYDAMYLYGLWLNYSSTVGISIKNGQEFLKFSMNRTFPGISGPCDIGPNGDKIPYFWYQQFLGTDGHAETVAISETKKMKITDTIGFKWSTSDGKPPKDIPDCGFFNELCRTTNSAVLKEKDVLIVVYCLLVILLATAAVIIGYTIRRRKVQDELLQSIWKVSFDDIELYKSKAGVNSKISMKSDLTLLHNSGDKLERAERRALLRTLGLYKCQLVSIRQVSQDRVRVLSNEALCDLKTMFQSNHDNINQFIGASFNPPPACVLFLYCPKGSLKDILGNDEIKLDMTFKISLLMDLIQGMQYIHNSKLIRHGRLKSSNCLVDNRWVLKVTDYGLNIFLDSDDENSVDKNKSDKYKSLLWTAPELLRNPSMNYKGTQEGDVYAFGIIVHEILYRMGTFAQANYISAKDIIERVKIREIDPCRPEIFLDMTEITTAFIRLMQICWTENACERPSFSVALSFVKKHIQQGSTTNIVDVVLRRLEKYASNLEELVDERTEQLMIEKQRADKLLYRMLPRSVADHLKLGESVFPELFDSATIFFSDIVGFTVLAGMSTPMQVVDLLNDLYSCFDDIINQYEAYKVETIGDAYLVVSGIPTRNGDRHAGIIADMSMVILKNVNKFKIIHLPKESIMVRIGIHTGPCCAGVVGHSMPRYCLFGDTVNTASRMESNGAAKRIHISEATHLALQKLGGYNTSFRAEMNIKGKGLMNTYWLNGREEVGE